MRFQRIFPLVFVLALVAACAPKAKSAGEEREGDKDYAAQGDDDEPGGGKRRGSPPTEASHQRFVTTCTKTPDMAEYCECGWKVMARMFSREEMEGRDVNDVRMARLKQEVGRKCIDKMPEPALREAFIGGCKRDDGQLEPYCGCMWSELRKTFSAGDLAQSEIVKKASFKGAVNAGAKACTAKLPEPVVKKAFFAGCAKKQGYEAFCTCGWKELRKRASLGEIQSSADTPEMKAIFDEVGKKCMSLLPGGANPDQ